MPFSFGPIQIPFVDERKISDKKERKKERSVQKTIS